MPRKRTPRNSDGGVWRLTWKQVPSGYEGWVVGHPKVRAVATTFDAMSDLLADRIGRELQAGEWTADWFPPPPKDPAKRGQLLDSHVQLVPEGTFVALNPPSELFESWCDACGAATGPRTKKPLQVVIESPGNMCFDFGSAPGRLSLVSTELADMLSSMLPPELSFRPVKRLGRGRKQFVEPVLRRSARVPSPVACVNAGELGWRCVECGFPYIYHSSSTFAATAFYAKQALRERLPLFPVIHLFGDVRLCLTKEWWDKNRRKPFASGVVTRPVGVLDQIDVDPLPRLRPRTQDWDRTTPSHAQRWLHTQERAAERLRIPFAPWRL